MTNNIHHKLNNTGKQMVQILIFTVCFSIPHSHLSFGKKQIIFTKH